MSLERERALFASERRRIVAAYRRRAHEGRPATYAPWRAEELFMRTGRRRVAAALLGRAGVFPQAGDPCLEIGFGVLGWLGDLLGWGLRERDLHGIELDPAVVDRARETLPAADLRVGDATELPWAADAFHLVIASTVFTSILAPAARQAVAREIRRVLAPGGALLWYDFAVGNPWNRDVRRVGRRELSSLFPDLRGPVRSVTLAPPLARLVAPRSWLLATVLESVPLLRTHLVAVLRKGR